MSEVARFPGDVVITGSIIGITGIAYPDGSIIDADINASAAISASKCQRSVVVLVSQAGTAVTSTHLVHFCKGTTGTIKQVTVSNITACAGASVVTVDVKKNAVTILSAVQTLDSTTAAYSENIPTISVSSLADGNYLTVHITATASGTDTLASGVMCQIEIDEAYEA